MDNTLVKTLKKEVQNDELLKVNEIRFALPANSSPNYANAATNNTQRIYIDCGVGITGELTALSGGFKALNSEGATDLASPQTARIFNFDCTPGTKCSLNKKYSIFNFTGPQAGPGIIINIELFEDSNGLDTILANGDGVTGNIAVLNNKTMRNVNLKNSKVTGNVASISAINGCLFLYLTNCVNITGNIESLGTFDKLTEIDVSGSSVKGNLGLFTGCKLDGAYVNLRVNNTQVAGGLEGFIESQWSRGRRSGNIYCYLRNCGVTLNDKETNTIVTCTFSDSSVVCSSNETGHVGTATYNGSTWSYTGVYQ